MTKLIRFKKILWLAQTLRYLFTLAILTLITGCVDTRQIVEDRLFGDQLTLIWSKRFDGPINLPPVITEDNVIVAPEGNPLVALDATTGEQRWQFAPSLQIWERAIAASDDFVYVGLEGGRLLALDIEDGEIQWGRDLEINVQHAPLVVNYALFVSTTYVGPGLDSDPQGRAKLFALNAFDGEFLWEYQTDNYILQTPQLFQERIYVAGSYQDPSIDVDEGGPMRLYALSTTNGNPFWTFESRDGFTKALYATQDAVAYVAYQDFISALDIRSGELLWRKDTGNWVPSLSGAGDAIYFGSAN
ncbi:MAG: PQQ-binding-like beta-propeller repeat protein, partial [Anaerolineales bacterium]